MSMASFGIQSAYLTDKELKKQLNAVVSKMRRAFDLHRWKTQEDFSQNFSQEIFEVDVALIKLKEAMKLTKNIDWYEQAKHRKQSR